MSEVKVNKISPRTNCGTTTLGDSGDTFTIPSGVTITNNGTQTGFGRTGTVDWVTTIQTSGFTAANGKGYFVNTTSGSITVNLPAGSAGDIVAFKDYANTWDSNTLNINPNGSDKIGGTTGTLSLSTESQSITLIFIDSTKGWLDIHDSTSNVQAASFICASVSGTGNTLTTAPCCSNMKIATFTGPGTFTVNSGSGGFAKADYVVVAGGGGGGGGSSGSVFGAGGGGAGGYRESHADAVSGPYTASPLATCVSLPLSPGAYPIVIGGGGAGSAATNPSCRVQGANGSNSTFSTIISTGGGAGGSRITGGCTPTPTPLDTARGRDGGSGGGSSEGGNGFTAGGLGNTPPVNPPQGNPGGDGVDNPPGLPSTGPSSCSQNQAIGPSGGGGAGAKGTDGFGPTFGNGGSPNGEGRNGGAGVTTSITGSAVARAGGGASGGSGPGSVVSGGTGGTGGGGNGGGPSGAGGDPGCNATVNTGGGGGGSSGRVSPNPGGTGGNGGSGIVIIRYKFQ